MSTDCIEFKEQRYADFLKWDAGSIRGLGWSEDEKLLVVSEEGMVRRYLDFYGDFTQFTLGNVGKAIT